MMTMSPGESLDPLSLSLSLLTLALNQRMRVFLLWGVEAVE